jgi:hypothetical protein
MATSNGVSAEAVYRQVDGALTDELVQFWTGAGILDESSARNRASGVVAVLRDGEGRLCGTCSVVLVREPAIGNRPIWFYRQFIAPEVLDFESFQSLFSACRDALKASGSGEGEGVLVLIEDPGIIARHPELVWEDTGLLYIGRTSSGAQMRICWLKQWNAGEDPSVGDHYQLDYVWKQVDAPLAEELVSFWLEENALPRDVAEKRPPEVVSVARDDDNRIIGVCTAERSDVERLGLPVWNIRALVTARFRRSSVGLALLHRSYEKLDEAFQAGDDPDVLAAWLEVQNPGLRQLAPEPLWAYGRFAFVGEDAYQSHLRVQYFTGARLPAAGGGNPQANEV